MSAVKSPYAKFDGVPRSELEERILMLLEQIDYLTTVRGQLADNLTSVQTLCTNQEEELRLHRREARLVGTPDLEFYLDAAHEGYLAKTKYPGPYALGYMLVVLAEETGEAARAYCHKEGVWALRMELAQVAGVCARIATECLDEIK